MDVLLAAGVAPEADVPTGYKRTEAGVNPDMQQLLTGRTRLPRFSGEWEKKRFGDICTFLSTANNPRAELEGRGKSVEITGVGNEKVVAGLHTILCRAPTRQGSRSQAGSNAVTPDRQNQAACDGRG